ncbi:hypothetical protein CDAR_16631 [Caerostris darwini]|uniref:Uncharacterized protein n=1 Tax=Caerostris darwini TaxID=1538125 RepID=A0AAV4RFC5_9ARAC|nr:hypothetical protein CDAR_16631 [Caerostris darwini]
MNLSADMDSENEEDRKLIKLIQEMAEFKTKFPINLNARFSTANGPHQDHLQVPSSGAAAEALITESPMSTVPLYHSEADHCMNITAAKIQLKEKAVDMMRQIIKKQNILIDGCFIEPHAIKPTMDGLKKAEDALAEATKRGGSNDHSADDTSNQYILSSILCPFCDSYNVWKVSYQILIFTAKVICFRD